MPSAYPSLALIFGPFDPSSSSSLPSDTVTCAAFGCHALGALTAVLVRDTAVTESIHPIGPETIDDQARCVLEDMTVTAIKVGALYTPESVSVVAQIAADYNHVPLLLHLTRNADESLVDDTDPEDLQLAIFELLLPQTDIVVVDHLLLEQWQSQGLFAGSSADTPAQVLLEYGATWVLVTGMPVNPGQGSYVLLGRDKQTTTFPSQALPARLADPDGPLTCAITAELARASSVPDAVKAAVALAGPITARSFQPGMGLRLIDRCVP